MIVALMLNDRGMIYFYVEISGFYVEHDEI